MSALITEDWKAQRLVPGKSGIRAFDITGVATFADALSALQTMEGVYEGAAYPLALAEPLSIDKGGLDCSWNGRMVRVVATYTPGAAVSAGTGGEGDPPPTTPVSKKWSCKLSFIFDSTTQHRTIDGAGVAITNSNLEFANVISPSRDLTVVLTMERFETGSGLNAKALAYYRKWNLAPVTFPKIGTAQPGESMLAGIEVPDEFTSDSTYLRVRYTFHAKRKITAIKPGSPLPPDAVETEDIHGFRRYVPDAGWSAYLDADHPLQEIQKRKAQGRGGQQPTNIVPLNGRGAPLNSAAYGLYKTGATDLLDATNRDSAPTHYLRHAQGIELLYDDTDGSADLNDLNISANL